MASKAKIYLYKEGNECTALTGGWIQGYKLTNGSFVKNSNNLNVSVPAVITTTNEITCTHNNSININLYSKLYIENSYTKSSHSDSNVSGGDCGIIANKTDLIFTTSYVKERLILPSYSGVQSFDISSISGSLFVAIDAFTTTSISVDRKIYNVYLETKENIITINSQTSDNIIFTCNNLGLVTVSKAEVLLNGVVTKTYTSNLTNVNYAIDKSKLIKGTNKINVRVTYSQGDNITSTVEEVLTHINTVLPLPTNAGFKAKNDRDELLYNSLLFNVNKLKTTLDSKDVDVTNINEMSILVDKVNLFDKYIPSPLYLYKDGDECATLTGGWLQGYKTGDGSIVKNASNIVITVNPNLTGGYTVHESCVTSNNLIDLTNYNKLKIYSSYVKTSHSATYISGCDTGIMSDKSKDCYGTVAYNRTTDSTHDGIITIDISNITGSYYVGACALSTINSIKVTRTITKIWLER